MGRTDPAYQLRKLCEQADNYSIALKLLNEMQSTTTTIFTIIGNSQNEGAIVINNMASEKLNQT